MSGRRPPEPYGRAGGDRLIALFLLALVLFNPPLLAAFGAPATLFGWPSLPIYIFGVWLAIIALIALAMERKGRDGDDRG
ncbi:hypothetical protein N825_11205 [Skermanella stibiiresistens SB22]|uniref:Uncharacterized protein n=1 Tax=Skermanella stibiiresistens SB22 TaxID=1385369 RepID=W9GXU1_9PROT|nr:hypothetical protein [Skermanella stibiiresistens]EWY38735.1 hypothetical protein N825_11205 [Skermanella stibiiresistens SB22]